MPFIYGMIVPIAFLDLSVCLYQAICFRLYDIPRVSRADYFRFNRSQLPFLSVMDKLDCNYCSYANGVLKYAGEIIARTELYWCPLRNMRDAAFKEPLHHRRFISPKNPQEVQELLRKGTSKEAVSSK